jgi:hypothetical protein
MKKAKNVIDKVMKVCKKQRMEKWRSKKVKKQNVKKYGKMEIN